MLTIGKAVMDPKSLEDTCDICQASLQKQYIKCGECKYQICLKCFACGAEFKNHVNNHAYSIINDNVKIFVGSTWSANEDNTLLTLLGRYGFSNWTDIGRKLNSHTADECRKHYIQYYMDGIFSKACQLTRQPYIRTNVPYLYRQNAIDPPRNNDFDIPFDASAENIISELHEDWNGEFKEIGEHLNFALIQAYNHRLRERQRRHKIVREHGLIIPNRIKSWLAKCNRIIYQNRSQKSGKFVALMQLTTGICFDRIVEGLQYENDLKKFLHKLYELRANGLSTFQGGHIYQHKRAIRASKDTSKSLMAWEWKHLQMNNKNSLTGTEQILRHCMDLNQLPKKRKSTPLNIIGLTNYEKLTKEEQELCSRIRLVPDSYLIYKNLLMGENIKTGYLRLADARRLIKIDVNKTRVMYDFLFEHGYISKPSQ